MPSDIQSPGSNDDKYVPTYKLDEKTFQVWKGFWEELFHHKYDLEKSDVYKMTDTFIKFISSQMGTVLDHALKIQKANDKKILSPESPDDPT